MTDRCLTVDGVLDADRMLETFDRDPDGFARSFETANREALGGLLLLASTAIREIAQRDGVNFHDVRQELRDNLATAVLRHQMNGEHP